MLINYVMMISGATLDQNMGEGRGQNIKGRTSPLIAKCKAAWGKLQSGPTLVVLCETL